MRDSLQQNPKLFVLGGVLLFLGACSTNYLIVDSERRIQVAISDANNPSAAIIPLGQTPLKIPENKFPIKWEMVRVKFHQPGFAAQEILIPSLQRLGKSLEIGIKLFKESNQLSSHAYAQGLFKKTSDARFYITSQKYDLTLEQINAALRTDDQLPELFVLQGTIFMLLNQPQKAKKSWGQALKLDPDNREAKLIIKKLNKLGL